MGTKEIVIWVVAVLAVLILAPVVYTNWPRDPNPEADMPKILELQQALAKYHKDFGELPKDLKYLVPTYIASIPIASNREHFIYNPANGQVTPPYPLKEDQQKELNRMGGGYAGGSPMTEVMTGISIRNELNY